MSPHTENATNTEKAANISDINKEKIVNKPVRTYTIGIVGATGMVGSTILRILEERNIPIKDIYLFSQYPNYLRFRGQSLQTQPLIAEQLKGMANELDFLFTAAGGSVSVKLLEHVNPKTMPNTWWIDKTSAFRMEESVPLVVPEINATSITSKTKLISCPNCVAVPLALSLKPILKDNTIEHCFVSTYQSVSGAGREATKALAREQKNQDLGIEEKPEYFERHIAMNIIPSIDTMHSNMWTEEEIKIMQETQRILKDAKIIKKDINMDVTAVRVPTSVSHCATVTLLLKKEVSLPKLKQAIEKTKGLALIDGEGRFLTPKDVVGEDDVFINRLRVNPNNPKSLTYFIVSDNLRKGAALNGVQIMEHIIQNFY